MICSEKAIVRTNYVETRSSMDEKLLLLSRELARTWGTDYHRIRALICRLADGGWHPVSDLISLSAISHWNITHLLQQLGDWVEQKEDRVRFRRDCIALVMCVLIAPAYPTNHSCPLMR